MQCAHLFQRRRLILIAGSTANVDLWVNLGVGEGTIGKTSKESLRSGGLRRERRSLLVGSQRQVQLGFGAAGRARAAVGHGDEARGHVLSEKRDGRRMGDRSPPACCRYRQSALIQPASNQDQRAMLPI